MWGLPAWRLLGQVKTVTQARVPWTADITAVGLPNNATLHDFPPSAVRQR